MVAAAELVEGDGRQPPPAGEPGVVAEDQGAVAGDADVELDAVDPGAEDLGEGLAGGGAPGTGGGEPGVRHPAGGRAHRRRPRDGAGGLALGLERAGMLGAAAQAAVAHCAAATLVEGAPPAAAPRTRGEAQPERL